MFKRVLAGILLCIPTFSFAFPVEVCYQRAEILFDIADARDHKVKKEELIKSFDFTGIPTAVKNNFLTEVDIIYKNPKKTPPQLAQDYFDKCLKIESETDI